MTGSYDSRLQYAYQMGRDSILAGCNTTNCHFSLFATVELMKAWEKGRKDAAEEQSR